MKNIDEMNDVKFFVTIVSKANDSFKNIQVTALIIFKILSNITEQAFFWKIDDFDVTFFQFSS